MATQEEQLEQFKAVITDRDLWVSLSGKLTIGTLSGYLIGNFVKQLTDQAIWYVGLSALLVGGLHYMKWVEINWRQIDADVTHIVEKAKKAEEEKKKSEEKARIKALKEKLKKEQDERAKRGGKEKKVEETETVM